MQKQLSQIQMHAIPPGYDKKQPHFGAGKLSVGQIARNRFFLRPPAEPILEADGAAV